MRWKTTEQASLNCVISTADAIVLFLILLLSFLNKLGNCLMQRRFASRNLQTTFLLNNNLLFKYYEKRLNKRL